MADALSKYLSSGGQSYASITGDKLVEMGKQAAAALVEKGIPLHQSIVKMASETPSINSEQVRRLVEFSNTEAYLAFHEKNKLAGADSSYPQFRLADPGEVLTSLSPNQEKTSSIDLAYRREPKKTKLATPKLDAELEQLFVGEGGKDKTASLDFTTETAVAQIMEAKDNLTYLKEHLETSGERVSGLLKEAEAEYYDTVKRFLLDNGNFADVMRAALEVTNDKVKISSVMVPVVARLLTEKVATAEKLKPSAESLEKIAHREVDETHPLVANVGAILSLSEETEKVAIALATIDEQLAVVKKTIREEFLAARG